LQALAPEASHRFWVSTVNQYLFAFYCEAVSYGLVGCFWGVECEEHVGDFLLGFALGWFLHPYYFAYCVVWQVGGGFDVAMVEQVVVFEGDWDKFYLGFECWFEDLDVYVEMVNEVCFVQVAT
jgi:hypothetical protein